MDENLNEFDEPIETEETEETDVPSEFGRAFLFGAAVTTGSLAGLYAAKKGWNKVSEKLAARKAKKLETSTPSQTEE